MNTYQSTPDFYRDYIEHFGILGMHWGKRNGPPYPLGSDISTGKRLKKGAGGESGSVTRKKRKLLTFGSKTKDGKIIRTNRDLINESVNRALEERQEKINKVANDNQDMFNDLLFESYYGNDRDRADKQARDLLKKIAKENGVNAKDLGKKVLSDFEKREQSIAEDKRKSKKTEELNNARKNDMYSIDFLEAVQNADWYGNKNKMINEYSKYLDDPEKYWRTRHD